MRFGKIKVDGINIFYRTAGKQSKPTLVLFHGFPSASHMFRDLMPMLEDDFYMIAPDYPAFQKYLRTFKPPLLAVWGKNDPSFIPAGAEAFLQDVPDAEIHLVDSGHFALESRCGEIAEYIKRWLEKVNK